MDEFLEAKTMYFDYEGSPFFMDRNGELEKFERYQVPASLLRAWDAELKQRALAGLTSYRVNWGVIHFLRHHGHAGHLHDLVGTPPRGDLRDRCIYLEELLRYVDLCADDA